MAEQPGALAVLNDDLLCAHTTNDFARIIDLYARAGALAFEAGDVDAGCFYTTHAYVYALQEGVPEAETFRKLLYRHGREA